LQSLQLLHLLHLQELLLERGALKIRSRIQLVFFILKFRLYL
jgi:hypothetical protein